MNKQRLSYAVATYGAPAAVIIGGLVLIFSPDTATALISTVLGWGALGIGILLGVAAFAGKKGLKEIISAVLCVLLGLWLTRNPLSLAVAFGKLVGLGLLIGGLSGYRKSASSGGRTLSLAEGAFGVLLLLVPMAASRVVYTVVGILLVVAGIAMLMSRIKDSNRPGNGPRDIIDV